MDDLQVLLICTLFVSEGVHFLSQGSTHPIVVGHLVNESGVPVNGNSVFAPRRVIMNILLASDYTQRGLDLLSLRRYLRRNIGEKEQRFWDRN